MTKKRIEKVFAEYAKTKDLKPVCRLLKQMFLYITTEVKSGLDIDFLDTLPTLTKLLNTLDLDDKK